MPKIQCRECGKLLHWYAGDGDRHECQSTGSTMSMQEVAAYYIVDLKASNKLFSECLRRGTKLWRDAHPEAGLVIPDGAKNIAWLLERLTRADVIIRDCTILRGIRSHTQILFEDDDVPDYIVQSADSAIKQAELELGILLRAYIKDYGEPK